MSRKRVLPLALAAVAGTGGVASAATHADQSHLRKAQTPLTVELAGGVVTISPQVSGQDLRVNVGHRRALKVVVDDAAGTATFDVLDVDGETFTLDRLKTKRGKVRFRLVATSQDGQQVVGRFRVVAKVLVPSTTTSTDSSSTGDSTSTGDDSTAEAEGTRQGRGPETRAEREARKQREPGRRGRGRDESRVQQDDQDSEENETEVADDDSQDGAGS